MYVLYILAKLLARFIQCVQFLLYLHAGIVAGL